MYGQLISWLIEKLNDQVDEGPLENISDWLAVAGHPSQTLISIGATLEGGDQCIVALYDENRYDGEAIRRIASGEDSSTSDTSDTTGALGGLSLLRQEVI